MRRWIPTFVLAALAVIAARPLWSAPFLFSYDGPLHLLRLYALDLTLRQGVVYPRWLLDLAYGYGYPIFNYYPPLSAYFAETLHIFGVGFAETIKLAFTLFIVAALSGAYVLASDLYAGEKAKRPAGLLTAVAYVFFPYFMVGIYTRGALAEAFAVAVLPWLVWSTNRLIVRQTTGSLLLVALLLTVLVLAHDLTAVIAAPFLLSYVLFQTWRLSPIMRMRALGLAAASVILSVALTAFFWLPFLAELPLVRMGTGMAILQDIFESNFSRPDSLVQTSLIFEYGGPPVPLGLAAMSIGLIVLVGAIVAGRKLKQRGTILFFGALSVMGAAAITEPARAIWLAIPQSSMIQSVWRVELLINLGIAVVIGSLPIVLPSILPFERLRLSRFASQSVCQATVVLIALILVWTTIARLAPAAIILPGDAFDLAHLARFEVSGASPGTTTFGEYLPITMKAGNLVSFRAPSEQNQSALIPDIRLLAHDGMEWILSVNSAEPFSFPLRAFYFPDWKGTIDGTPARVYGSTSLGLLTVDVPAGEHEVRLFAVNTPIRQFGILIAVLAVLVVIGVIAFAVRRRDQDLWMSLVILAALIVIAVVCTSAALTSSPGRLESKRVGVSKDFDLVGLKVENASLDTDAWLVDELSNRLHIQVYWQAKTSGLAAAPITWRLTDGTGRIWSQRAQFPRYGTALQPTWVPNEIVQDEYDLPMDTPIPPGRYSLQVSTDNVDFVAVGSIELQKENQPAAEAPTVPEYHVDALLGNEIRLIGYSAPTTAWPGEHLDMTIYWQAERDVFEDHTASVQLLDPGGKLAAQHDSITSDGMNPTSLWMPGETSVERVQLELPRDLPTGAYSLIALMYNLADQKRLSVMTESGFSPDNAVHLGQVHLSNDLLFNLLGLNLSFF